jgi:hypothetical protein
VPNPPLTQTGSAATYTVFDADNTDLQATGTAVEILNADTGVVLVDFDQALTDGTDYVLRVAAGSVQNSDNTPNPGQVIGFEADLDDLEPFVEFDFNQTFITSDNTPTLTGDAFVAVDRDIASVTFTVDSPDGDNVFDDDAGSVNVGPEVAFSDFYDTAEIDWTPTLDEGDGQYRVRVTITDDEGESTTLQQQFNLDTSAPVITNIAASNTTPNDDSGINITFDLANATCVGGCDARVLFNGTEVGSDSDNSNGGNTIAVTVPASLVDVDDIDVTVEVTDDANTTSSSTAADLVDSKDNEDQPIPDGATFVDGDSITISFDQATDIDDATDFEIRDNLCGAVIATGTAVEAGQGTSNVTITVAGDVLVNGSTVTVNVLAATGASDLDDADNDIDPGCYGPFVI